MAYFTRELAYYLLRYQFGEKNLKLKLFNAHTVDPSNVYNATTQASFTELTTANGYTVGGKTLASGSTWTLTKESGTTKCNIKFNTEQVWQATNATFHCHGYFVVSTCDAASVVLFWEEGSWTSTGIGDTYDVTPKVEL